MDGKNVDTVLMELGVRFHRLIYEHLQQYSYSCMGGMLAICDVAEYRKCAKDFKVSLSCKSSPGRKSFEDVDGYFIITLQAALIVSVFFLCFPLAHRLRWSYSSLIPCMHFATFWL